ncbi:MAG: VWA domain-containing protein [Actinomycetes bacterium]
MTTPDTSDEAPAPSAIYVLLDRSGSMGPMVDDVVGGFNNLLSELVRDGSTATMTLVQFDSGDPQEVVADAVPVAEMLPLDATTFVPRGGTPLLDATGRLINRAAARARQREAEGLAAEEVLFISITDGHENQSTEFTLEAIRSLVDAYTTAGWQFVFMGAGLDVYQEAQAMGYAAASVQAFLADGAGTREAFGSLSSKAVDRERKLRHRERIDTRDFFEGDKPAEEDRRRRGH